VEGAPAVVEGAPAAVEGTPAPVENPDPRDVVDDTAYMIGFLRKMSWSLDENRE